MVAQSMKKLLFELTKVNIFIFTMYMLILRA